MTDLTKLLQTELNAIVADMARLSQRRAAVMLILGDDNLPEGTFTADDAKEHERQQNRVRLSDDDIKDIRRAARDGATQNNIAEMFGISRSTAGNVINKRGAYA